MSAEQHSVFQNFIIRTPPSFGGYPPIVITLPVHIFCRTLTHEPMIFQNIVYRYIVIRRLIIYHSTCGILKQFILH
jgi:hypothetical protein